MRKNIKKLLEDLLPLVDLESDFLFSDLDSLGVTTILMTLSAEYGIELEAKDATPKNLKTLDSIVAMVEEKLKVKSEERRRCRKQNARTKWQFATTVLAKR